MRIRLPSGRCDRVSLLLIASIERTRSTVLIGACGMCAVGQPRDQLRRGESSRRGCDFAVDRVMVLVPPGVRAA